MKRVIKREFKRILYGSEVFAEVLLYLLMFGIFINIIISIYTFELIDGFIKVGINVGLYVLLLAIIEFIKWTRKKFGIKVI